MMFDLETDTDLIEQRIYERQALLARYRYLLSRARELGLHTILQKYQPLGCCSYWEISLKSQQPPTELPPGAVFV